jgi:RHH-type proline utilization regulon transcriptional repressor/proline dehydrogenase/delta 1-pyrroline-5-carboxylate dehydrogenase
VSRLAQYAQKPNPRIALPEALYAPHWRNSAGINFTDPMALEDLYQRMRSALSQQHYATALVGGEASQGAMHEIRSPADHRKSVGVVYEADRDTLEQALALGRNGQGA